MDAMTNDYSSPSSYSLIYVYAIPGSADHAGLLKVGGATLKSTQPHTEFPPNCAPLNAAAHARIKQQTNTAGIKYNLLYTEIAVRWTGSGASRYLSWFLDHDVHNVLEHTGFKHVKMPGTKAREWYKADLETVKKAIKATKDGRVSLNSNEIAKPAPFKFREEQEEAIKQTLARFKKHTDMLWDAKMRFGKTPTALEVVRRGAFRKTIIITHRPVVATNWKEDYLKIFPTSKNETPYEFIDKFSASGASSAVDEAAKKRLLESYDKNGRHFIYFASIQDLRGSKHLGGAYLKNEVVFDTTWDFVIVDEAHEGTQTELGKKVSAALSAKGHTRVLSLSGTPFNILDSYKDDDSVFVWDYTQEQKTKSEWETKHPGEPNPYATLPKMNILTFDLSKVMAEYAEEDLEGKAFNFAEFFRTWTGDKEIDGRSLPSGAKAGDFVHAPDVRKFLDLITTASSTSNYPFATQEHCDYFRHSLWMVPGVAEAKALSAMLQKHPIFRSFGVANVAGAGDDYEEEHYDNALELVRETIKKYPRSITLSCGKLTTGVTVPEWTAVMMLAGSVHTAASSYMQTIFRVQSPWTHDGQCKEECYVFDFAPDRTLTVLTETAQLSKRVKKNEAEEEKGRAALSEFLNFCSVLAMDGGRARPYDVKEMMRRLKHVFVMKAIRNGFDDPSIYNNEKLMKLGKIDLMKFDGLKGIVGKTKQTESVNSVDLARNGLDEEEWERRKADDEKRKGHKMTPKEEAARKKHLEELKRARDARDILRAISIRMPLLIYGADVPLDESISIRRFVTMVDNDSWVEFMPKGVTKKIFQSFVEYYDPDVFEEAGIEIRKLAKTAEKLPPGRRVAQIARIFGYFKNPDKETVLTPWRVVNMHMSDTLGGWCFFDSDFDEKKMPDDPRPVDRGDVTKRVFAANAKVLEINSKSGLYPLYVAYSIYRSRCGEIAEEDIAEIARAKKWREVLRDNVFVICKTPMAASITRRTLAGYTTAKVNAVCWDGDLAETLKSNPKKFTSKIAQGKFWGKEGDMEYDAIVGNPPYQSITGGGSDKVVAATQAIPIFNRFVDAAKLISPRYISMIIPARWYSGGMGLNEFRDEMIHDKRVCKLVDFIDSRDCFTSADIAGGLCYFLWDNAASDDCEVVNVSGGQRNSKRRHLDGFGEVFIRNNNAFGIIEKVRKVSSVFLDASVKQIDAFGFPSKARGQSEKFKGAVALIHSQGVGYIKKGDVKKNVDLINKYKVSIGILVPCNGEVGIDPRKGYKGITTPRILKPNEVTTFSYLVLGAFETEREAVNFDNYMRSKFARFMLRLTYSSMHISKQNFILVPWLDFKKVWTDDSLYAYYNLTDSEKLVIENTMRKI